MKRIVLFLMLFSSLLFAAQSPEVERFSSLKQEAQFKHLLKELRCLVCQNQDLADSHAPLAKDLRKKVYNWIILGKTDEEIRQELSARFGDFILFKPPVKGATLLLWFGPLLFFLIGLVIFFRMQRGGSS